MARKYTLFPLFAFKYLQLLGGGKLLHDIIFNILPTLPSLHLQVPYPKIAKSYLPRDELLNITFNPTANAAKKYDLLWKSHTFFWQLPVNTAHWQNWHITKSLQLHLTILPLANFTQIWETSVTGIAWQIASHNFWIQKLSVLGR